MGCCNGKQEGSEPADDYEKETYSKERLHVSKGNTIIDTKNCKLFEVDA